MIATRNKRRSGVTAVEFAMTLPVLMLLLFGSYEVSRANMIMHTCEAAAYEGARVGIVPGATAAEIDVAVRSILSTAGVQSATVTTVPEDMTTETDTVAVTIEVHFADNSTLVAMFMGSEPFVRTCEMTRESF